MPETRTRTRTRTGTRKGRPGPGPGPGPETPEAAKPETETEAAKPEAGQEAGQEAAKPEAGPEAGPRKRKTEEEEEGDPAEEEDPAGEEDPEEEEEEEEDEDPADREDPAGDDGFPDDEEEDLDLRAPGPEKPGDPGKKEPPKKRGRPPNPPRETLPFIRPRDASHRIGARQDQVRLWAESGQIPGIRYDHGIWIPEAWVEGVLDGSVMAPDGIPRTGKRREESNVKTTAPAGRNQEVLNKLQGLYGTDADLKVELSRRGPAGYAYVQELPHPPSKAELQGLFPEGGDFQLRIFKGGKVVDEVSNVIVDSVDGTPYDPSRVFSRPGGFSGPRPGFVGRMGGRTMDPGMGPPGLRPAGGMDDGVGYLARKAADFAFDRASKGGNGSEVAAVLQTVTEQQKTQYESLARSVEAERERAQKREIEMERLRKEEREEAEARRREEKEELEAAMEAQRQEYENSKKIELEKFKMEQEQQMKREREYLDRMKAAEEARTKAMMDSQSQFFTQMRELDQKRDEVMRESHKESLASQERLMASQREAIEEQRRANDRMFDIQMSHLADLKGTQEPLALIASAIGKGVEKIGPMVQARMNGMNPGLAGAAPARPAIQGGSVSGAEGDQSMFDVISKIKSQPFFVAELTAVADKVKKKVHPAFTVNKLLGMLQFDPSVAIILDYVVTADVREVVKGVRLPSEAATTLTSKEGIEWWGAFQTLLQQTMAQSVQQQAEAAPPPQGGTPQAPEGPALNPGL